MSFACTTEPLKDFIVPLRQKAIEERVPLYCHFALTHRCTFRCRHCYLGDQYTIRNHRDEELSTDEVKGILDQLVEAGTLFLILTGGDPLLRHDFVEIYTHAVKSGLLVTVYCNGSLITGDIVALWQKYPPLAIEVSMYGATEFTFEDVTLTPGSFQLFQEGIERLQDAGINYRLKTMLLKNNWHELDRMETLAQKRGVHFRYDSLLFPCMPNYDNGGRANSAESAQDIENKAGISLPEFMIGNCQDTKVPTMPEALQSPVTLRLTATQIAGIDFANEQRVETFFRPLQERQRKKMKGRGRLYGCAAGRSSCHITPYGRITPCVVSPGPTGDLRRDTVHWCWDNSFHSMLQEKFMEGDACFACEWRQACRGCPSLFALETGDQRKPSAEICNIAKERYTKIQLSNMNEEFHYEAETY